MNELPEHSKEMTPEEKRKYHRLKPLAYIAAYGYETPARVALAIALLTPGLIMRKTGELLEDAYYFLQDWLATAPLRAIFSRLGFYELHEKARKIERYQKTLSQD